MNGYPASKKSTKWECAPYGLWQSFTCNTVSQKLRWIPPGEFLMGSPEDEPERSDDENLHKVSLTQGFWFAETACTQELWHAVIGENPSDFKDNPQNPVEQVSWDDCITFTKTINGLVPGLALGLLTEAQWEYACRAMTTTPFWWGSELTMDKANYDGNFPYAQGIKGEDRNKTVPVISFDPNPWGLYQVHGNVFEWCNDWSGPYPTDPVVNPRGPDTGDDRVLRGGGWINYGRSLRSAFRNGFRPGYRGSSFGFRLSRGQEEKEK